MGSGRKDDDNGPNGGAGSSGRMPQEAQPLQRRQHSGFQRQRLEQEVINDFSRVLLKKFSSINAQDFKLAEYDFSLKFLKSFGLVEGLVAATFAFYGLNRFPRHFARYMTHQRQKPSSQRQGYVLDKTQKQHEQHPQSPFQTQDSKELGKQVSRKRNRFLFTTLELTFDLGMSIGVGGCVAIMATDRKGAMKTVTDVPLQPGRSLLSDRCCPSLLEEYKRQWRIGTKSPHTVDMEGSDKATDITKVSRKHILRRPDHDTLHFLKTLTENCRHRQVMERQLREEHALSELSPVAIPDSGVMPLTEDPLLVMLVEEEEDLGEFEALYSQSWSPRQIESWTSDQSQ